MRIEGERVTLRSTRPEDSPHLLRWSQDAEVARLAHGDYPLNLEQTLAWLEESRRDRSRQLFIIEGPDGRPIGDVDLHHIAWRSGEAELRIRIGEKSLWGQGLGTDSIRTLLDYVFRERRLQRVYLRVLRSNPRAIRCYEKCGFRKEGRMRVKDGDHPDEMLLMSVTAQRVLSARAGSPTPAVAAVGA